jgi:hypothetical protein
METLNDGSLAVSFIVSCAYGVSTNISQWTPESFLAAMEAAQAPSVMEDPQLQSSDESLAEEDDYEDSDEDPTYVPPPPKLPKDATPATPAISTTPVTPAIHATPVTPALPKATTLLRSQKSTAQKHKRNKSSTSNPVKAIKLDATQVEALIANINTAGFLGDKVAARATRLGALKTIFKVTIPMCGEDEEMWCLFCYHPGHEDEDDFHHCPVARLKSYINDEFATPYEVGSSVLGHIDLFFADFSMLVEGHTWAMDSMANGDGSSFGITVEHLRRSEQILLRCQMLQQQGLIIRQNGFEIDEDELFVS